MSDYKELPPPYLCACGLRFTESDFNEHRKTCAVEWAQVSAPMTVEQMLDGDTPAAIYKRGHAAGAAEERARIAAALEQAISDTRERCHKLSETDEYPSVLGELDGLRRFAGKVRQ